MNLGNDKWQNTQENWALLLRVGVKPQKREEESSNRSWRRLNTKARPTPSLFERC